MKFLDDFEDTEASVEINVTPLVDIVFNLLIFFMVSTTFIGAHGIDVRLPQSSTSTTENVKNEVNISIDQSGGIFLDSKAETVSVLKEEFARAFAENNEVTLVVNADQAAHHGRVVEVMDLAQEAGIKRIAIATVPKESS